MTAADLEQLLGDRAPTYPPPAAANSARLFDKLNGSLRPRPEGFLFPQGRTTPVRPSFYIVYTNGSPGFFSTGAGVAAATRVPLRTDRVKNTLPPTTEPSPMSVSPPRMDAPE